MTAHTKLNRSTYHKLHVLQTV